MAAELSDLQAVAVEQIYNLWARGELEAVDNIARGRGISAEEALKSIRKMSTEVIGDVSNARLLAAMVREDGAATFVDVPVTTVTGDEVGVVTIGVHEDFPGLLSTWIQDVRIPR